MKQVQWGIPSAIFSLALAVALALGVAKISSDVLDLPVAEAFMWSLIAQSIGLLVVPFAISYLKGNGPITDFQLKFSSRDISLGISFGIIILVVGVAIATIQMELSGDFTSAAAQAAGLFKDKLPLLVGFIFLVAIVGPFVEEVAFRGMWFSALERKFNSQIIAIVGSALVFSVIHIEPQRILLIFITGIILGYLRSKTKSLPAPIIAHMVNNTPGALGFLILTTGPMPI